MTRPRREFVALGFASTHDALAAESLLKDLGVPLVPVPAPRELGSICGIALRFEPEDVHRAKDLLERADIAWTGEAALSDV